MDDATGTVEMGFARRVSREDEQIQILKLDRSNRAKARIRRAAEVDTADRDLSQPCKRHSELIRRQRVVGVIRVLTVRKQGY